MELKKCRYCNHDWPKDQFGVALTTPQKTYRRRKCNQCYATTKRLNRRRKIDWLRELKKSLCCSQCGFSHPAALDFHHQDGTKEANISLAVRSWSKERTEKEIAKCTVLCANCHRIHHDSNRG